MIERVGGAAIRAYAAHRRRALEGVARDAVRVQEVTLLHLVRSARATEFGRSHGFDAIHSVADYQARTPLGDYLRFMPLWSRALEGERDVHRFLTRHRVQDEEDVERLRLVADPPELVRYHVTPLGQEVLRAAEQRSSRG